MKKKLVSLFLALAMCLGLCVPAFAADTSRNSPTLFIEGANGLYKQANIGFTQAFSELSTVSATPTQNSNIFYVSSNNYLVRTFEDNYVLSERYNVDIHTFDPEDYLDIPIDVLEQLAEEINKQLQLKNEDFTATIYAPITASSTTRNHWGSIYSYGPYQLKDYFIELGNSHTGWVEKTGKSASDWAAKLYDAVLSTTGVVSKHVSVISAGISVLDFALEAAGIKVVPRASSDDYVTVDTVFNKLGKSTYVLENGDWQFSLQTASATVTTINTYCFYPETGKTPMSTSNPNTSIATENYNNPRKAIEMLGVGYSDDPIRYTVWDIEYIV